LNRSISHRNFQKMTIHAGEIRLFSYSSPPKGWLPCNGQVLQISDYRSLFNAIGRTWGGDGTSNFALPNLQGRVPIHVSAGDFVLGQSGGAESVTLSAQHLYPHTHRLSAQTEVVLPSTDAQSPAGKTLAAGQVQMQGGARAPLLQYGLAQELVPMSPQAISTIGGGQPHDNIMPSTVLCFMIALADGVGISS
jgi:microcystin-dependent protein